MNRHDEFCELVRSFNWMSETIQNVLITQMQAAMRDAFERGVDEGRSAFCGCLQCGLGSVRKGASLTTGI
jgi:hypothetical protein